MSSETPPDPAAYQIDGVTPDRAWRPGSAEEVAELLASAAAEGQVVSPQGGRTALALGRPLERYDVALDLTGLDSTVAYEPDDLTVTVGAGMSLRALQSMLAEYGQYLPIDPPPDGSVSIGGLLATFMGGVRIGGRALEGHLTPEPVILALAVSVAIGLVFGIYPANRAARLRPIEALRYE